MQKPWQDGAADEYVRCGIGITGSHALTKALRTLNIIGDVRRLVDAGHERKSDESHHIGGSFVSDPELQFGCERHGMGIIGDVEIGDEA
jgi:hypothetical protein